MEPRVHLACGAVDGTIYRHRKALARREARGDDTESFRIRGLVARLEREREAPHQLIAALHRRFPAAGQLSRYDADDAVPQGVWEIIAE